MCKRTTAECDSSAVAGDVTVESHNGAIQVKLEGNTFDGRQMSLSTYNGGVTVSAPASYSASIETKTRGATCAKETRRAIRR